MSFNTFGRVFRFSTWGESHGPALVAIIDGMPSDVEIDAARGTTRELLTISGTAACLDHTPQGIVFGFEDGSISLATQDADGGPRRDSESDHDGEQHRRSGPDGDWTHVGAHQAADKGHRQNGGNHRPKHPAGAWRRKIQTHGREVSKRRQGQAAIVKLVEARKNKG